MFSHIQRHTPCHNHSIWGIKRGESKMIYTLYCVINTSQWKDVIYSLGCKDIKILISWSNYNLICYNNKPLTSRKSIYWTLGVLCWVYHSWINANMCNWYHMHKMIKRYWYCFIMVWKCAAWVGYKDNQFIAEHSATLCHKHALKSALCLKFVTVSDIWRNHITASEQLILS